MDRHASIKWIGNLQHGVGKVSLESGALNEQNYSFSKRFENERGANPEELIAAAHAMCFSMAFTAELQKHNMFAESVEIHATVHLEQAQEGWSIPNIRLEVIAEVPNMTPAQLDEVVQTTHKNCPVSKLLNAEVSFENHLKPSLRQGFHPGPV